MPHTPGSARWQTMSHSRSLPRKYPCSTGEPKIYLKSLSHYTSVKCRLCVPSGISKCLPHSRPTRTRCKRKSVSPIKTHHVNGLSRSSNSSKTFSTAWRTTYMVVYQPPPPKAQSKASWMSKIQILPCSLTYRVTIWATKKWKSCGTMQPNSWGFLSFAY